MAGALGVIVGALPMLLTAAGLWGTAVIFLGFALVMLVLVNQAHAAHATVEQLRILRG